MERLYKKLESYGQSDYYPFHMPGHKRNRASSADARGIRETGHLQQMIFFLREILQRFQDLTIFIMRKEF